MASSFTYQRRKAEDWDKRSNQQGGNFIGFIKDEVRTFSKKKDNFVRMLPPTWEDSHHYGYDIWVHFSFGPQNATVLCPLKMKNKPCPGCEDYMEAEKAGREDAGKLKPTRRVLVWLINRNDEKEKKPEAWAMPWTLDRDITKICRDKQTGELYYIDDPEAGYDVSFEVQGESEQSKYVGVQLARRSSPVDQVYIDYIMKNPLPSILIWRSYEELAELLTGGAGEVENGQAPVKDESRPKQQELKPQAADYCSKTAIFKGETLACANSAGHSGDCDFSREISLASTQPPPQKEEVKGCTHIITVKGRRMGCKLVVGHPADCDFDIDLGPAQIQAATTASPQPTAAAEVRPISSRADALRSRFAKQE